MHIKLKRIDGSVIWAGEGSLAAAVTANRANLFRANLLGADLCGADLRGADLCGADLKHTHLGNPSRLLEASWGPVSDGLCRLLMAYDAANHPNGREAFAAWAAGGDCPYIGVKVSRAARFTERCDLWDADAPVLSAYELMVRLIREKCADSDFHAGGAR